ncbi:MAG: tetratricopeptide repeat protein [Nitrospirota bacterium]
MFALNPALIRLSLCAALWAAGTCSIARAAEESTADHRARALKQSAVSFSAAAVSFRETGHAIPPHIEILFEVPRQAEPLHAHHLPGWIRVSLDRLAPVEHTYTDREWHALVNGALHVLVPAAPFRPGSHTLVATFKGIDRNGKPYLRTKSFSLESARPAEHYVLRFHEAPNAEPSLSIESLGESLLRPRPGAPPAGDLAYRIGRFEAASGNAHGAASALLAAIQNGLPPHEQTDARLLLAAAYGTLGAPEAAETVLEQLAADTSDETLRARAWLEIERIAYQDGRHDRVLQAHARIGSALPPDLLGEARTVAGLSALALRAFAQAGDAFRAVPKSSADASLAAFGQAQALAGQGDAFTAITSLTKLTQARSFFNPVQSDVASYAHAALGFQLLEQARYPEAIEELRQVPSDHPMFHAALFAIGWSLSKAGEHVQAIAVFDDLTTRAPDGPYAHEARLAAAASYAELRAPTRSVAAYRGALDALGESAAALDRFRAAVRGPAWDPLSDDTAGVPASARRLLRDTPSIALALTRYHWLVQVERDLRRTLADFPGFLTAPNPGTLGGRLHGNDGSQLMAQGQDILTRIDVAKGESRKALASVILEEVDRERERVESWSIAASLGIARNLRDDIGRESLSLD